MSGRKTINLVGIIYGKLTVISQLESKKGQPYWLCKCECGNQKEIIGSNLRSGQSQSCGCERINRSREASLKRNINTNKFIDLTGKKVNKWTVLSRDIEFTKSNGWLCRCDCGIERIVCGRNLRGGKTKSCGCLQRAAASDNATHKMSKHPVYLCWGRMKNRCENPNASDYIHYGARGIKVCERWQNPSNFIEDMATSWKEGLSIDRVNVNGDYEPSNCKWITQSMQMRNTRKSVIVNTPWGEMNIIDAAKYTDIKVSTLYKRHAAGYSAEELFNPLRVRGFCKKP